MGLGLGLGLGVGVGLGFVLEDVLTVGAALAGLAPRLPPEVGSGLGLGFGFGLGLGRTLA